MKVMLYVVCCSVNVSVCFVCCVFDNVCELFGETIRNVFWMLLLFCRLTLWMCLVCVWWCSVGYTMYGLPKSVCVAPVIPMSV